MKIGFIGTGRITDSHLSSMRRLDLPFPLEPLGFFSPRQQSRDAAVSRWGGRAFESVDSLIAARPDAVYVTSPTPFHAEQACAVARAGIPLYLEKPAARTRSEFEVLRADVNAAGILNCLGVQWRYRPETDRLRDLFAANPPSLVVGQWYWFTPPVAWLRDRETGGGQVFDQLVHIIDVAGFLVGDATSVFARFMQNPNARYPDFRNWDSYTVSIGYQKAIGSFSSTYRLNVPMDDRVCLDFVCGDLFVRYQPSGIRVTGPEKTESYLDPGERGLDMVGRDHIERAFLMAVHTDDRSLIRSSVDDIANTMNVVFAATESAESGQPVEIA